MEEQIRADREARLRREREAEKRLHEETMEALAQAEREEQEKMMAKLVRGTSHLLLW